MQEVLGRNAKDLAMWIFRYMKKLGEKKKKGENSGFVREPKKIEDYLPYGPRAGESVVRKR
jgi:hypothetical protein